MTGFILDLRVANSLSENTTYVQLTLHINSHTDEVHVVSFDSDN